jgi:hypothetical protein
MLALNGQFAPARYTWFREMGMGDERHSTRASSQWPFAVKVASLSYLAAIATLHAFVILALSTAISFEAASAVQFPMFAALIVAFTASLVFIATCWTARCVSCRGSLFDPKQARSGFGRWMLGGGPAVISLRILQDKPVLCPLCEKENPTA